MANENLKKDLKDAGITFWALADELGVSEPTITRWMRHELKDETKKAVEAVIRKHKEDM